MSKSNSGLLIGRFQPFHKGHLYLITEALKDVHVLTIGIGTPLPHNKNTDPWDFEVRKKMIEKVIQEEGLYHKIKLILPVYDYLDDDEVWYEKTITSVPPFDIYFGGDEWTTGIFASHGHEVKKIPLFKRELYEGTKIRKLMREKHAWKNRIPAYIVKLIE